MEPWVTEVKERANLGKAPVLGGRSRKFDKISFKDLVFIPAQLKERPVDYFREEIASETVIGKTSKHPLKLKIPILIAAMSFGALSREAKIALAKASTITGTATNTGEGGMVPEERKFAKILIAQYSTGRFGVDTDYLKRADAIEIKIGQGAKPGCYSPDHEIFTEDGFKSVKEIEKGEKLWSVNPETNELELAQVVKVHKYPHNGPMIQAKAKSVDFLITPDHNLPIKLRHSKGWKFIKAKESMGRCEIRTSKRFFWNSKNNPPTKIKVPKIHKNAPHQKEYFSFPLKEWLRFSAWFISEGYCAEDRKIEISQTKKKTKEEIVNLLKEMNIDFKERPTRIVVYSKQLGKFMKSEFGNVSDEKKIPKWIRNLPKSYLALLLETLIKGDGKVREDRKNMVTYFTASETLMNHIVEIALKLGRTVTIRKDENTFEIDIRSGKLWHGLSSKPKTKSWQKEPTLVKARYKGFVYCPELDKNHTLIVKRNGKVSLNGNSGGMLPGEKVTKEIAKLRKVALGKPVHSPPYHPDIKNVGDLKKKVNALRHASGGKPIIIKLGAGDIENDVKLAVEANPDAIAIDGMEGGTGAAPVIMLDDFGIPTLSALIRARKVLDGLKARQQLLIGGGITTGADIAKAISMGADAVFMAFPLLVAMGCIYCRQCFKGECHFGITTQDPELRKRLNVEDAAKRVANFLTACTEEVKMAAAATGKGDVHQLDKGHLRSLSFSVSKITGVPMV